MTEAPLLSGITLELLARPLAKESFQIIKKASVNSMTYCLKLNGFEESLVVLLFLYSWIENFYIVPG